MGRFLSAVSRWISGKILLLLLIIAILIAGAWLQGELQSNAQLARDVETWHLRAAHLEQQRKTQLAEVDRQLDVAGKALGALRKWEQDLQLEKRQLIADFPIARRLPGTTPFLRLQVLEGKITAAAKAIVSTQNTLQRATELRNTADARFQGAIAAATRQAAGIQSRLAGGIVHRFVDMVRAQLPLALVLLLAAILLPIAIKLLLYFVVAPFAARRQPIQIDAGATGPIAAPDAAQSRISAISQPVVLQAGQELLIRPGFLQSSSVLAPKKTRWLLNARFPITSLLSGMFMLTRVGPAGEEPVVVSSTQDALSEVGILDLPAGAAFVCQPRALVGVIQREHNPIRITRHWRLFSLHAWLTLQLRFLAFHGPGQLVLQGCRGIRIEPATGGRLINQSATIGFSANARYANTRCETFVAYWTGAEDLFNDLFSGDAGVFVYEEMPALGRKTGITGRGLEGVGDAVLKVFGI